jgi:hypothetical protein
MAKAKQYKLAQPVAGSFIGSRGRVSYSIPAGRVSERDVDPEVLERLVAAGSAVVLTKADSKESA